MQNFEISVRALISKKDKILLCKKKDASYYFLPGGHIEFGEKAAPALKRELKEELNVSVDKLDYIGIIENIYVDKKDKSHHHEINLIFYTKAKEVSNKTPEDHIEFFWVDIKGLKRQYLEPMILKEAIIKWLKDKRHFWGSEE